MAVCPVKKVARLSKHLRMKLATTGDLSIEFVPSKLLSNIFSFGVFVLQIPSFLNNSFLSSVYKIQFSKKCFSSSMQPELQILQSLSSTFLLAYLPFSIFSTWLLKRNLVSAALSENDLTYLLLSLQI